MKIVGALFLVLNVSLLVVVVLLRSTVSGIREDNTQQKAQIKDLLEELQAERTRVASKSSLITKLEDEIKDSREGTQASSEGPEATGGEEDLRHAISVLTSRPELSSIEVLSDEEMKSLHAKRMAMPREFDSKAILQGDVDSILGDRTWNPGQRELSESERAELSGLLRDLQFFARRSPAERLENLVLPEVERLREAKAYVEYSVGQRPPRVEGATITHAEPSDQEGYKRLYYFFEEDYPELYHERTVERQRALESFVGMFEVINGRL